MSPRDRNRRSCVRVPAENADEPEGYPRARPVAWMKRGLSAASHHLLHDLSGHLLLLSVFGRALLSESGDAFRQSLEAADDLRRRSLLNRDAPADDPLEIRARDRCERRWRFAFACHGNLGL